MIKNNQNASFSGLPSELLDKILDNLPQADIPGAGLVSKDWRGSCSFRRTYLENCLTRTASFCSAQQIISRHREDFSLVRAIKLPRDRGAQTAVLGALGQAYRLDALSASGAFHPSSVVKLSQVASHWLALRQVKVELDSPAEPMTPLEQLVACLPPSVESLDISLNLSGNSTATLHSSWLQLADKLAPLQTISALRDLSFGLNTDENAAVGNALWAIPGFCLRLESLSLLWSSTQPGSEEDYRRFVAGISQNKNLKKLTLDAWSCSDSEHGDFFITELFAHLPPMVSSLTISPDLIRTVDPEKIRSVHHYQHLVQVDLCDNMVVSHNWASYKKEQAEDLSALNLTVFRHVKEMSLSLVGESNDSSDWEFIAGIVWPKSLRKLHWDIDVAESAQVVLNPMPFMAHLTARVPAELQSIDILAWCSGERKHKAFAEGAPSKIKEAMRLNLVRQDRSDIIVDAIII